MKNIEIYHFTHNKNIGDEIYYSFIKNNPLSCFSILIDNYNFNHTIEQIPFDFIQSSSIIAFEKSFVPLSLEIISNLKTEKRGRDILLSEFNILLMKGNKVSCALLTSAWYLSRLGILPYPKDTIIKTETPVRSEILNVLDLKFKNNEKKVMKIINSLFPEEKVSEKISHIFYDSKGNLHEGL